MTHLSVLAHAAEHGDPVCELEDGAEVSPQGLRQPNRQRAIKTALVKLLLLKKPKTLA